MKTTLFTVALFLVSHLSNSQRILEATYASWDNPNLSVETFADFVITGFTETNPSTGLLAPTFKISNTIGAPITNYYVDYPDAVYLMDFTVREATHTIVLTGMTAVTTGGTPYKMFVAEVDFMTGVPVQSSLEYTYSSVNSMIPHQVIVSETQNQVMVVGSEILGAMSSSNFASIPKKGFILSLDINNYNLINYSQEMDSPLSSNYDYDMLENITEVVGFGYFISGSANGPAGEQNLLTMGIDYSGANTFSNIIDNTNSRFAGSSVMYNASLNVVYLLANNSIIHQFQIAQCDPMTGNFLTPLVSHQIASLPIGSGVDQNGFRLQQSPGNEIIIGGYLSAPFGALAQLLTPFQIVMKDDLSFLAAKLYESDNNAPLSPSYFEEDGNSVFINTPDMIVYSDIENRTYLVDQNTNYGGVDLIVSSLYKTSICEKALKVTTFDNNPNIVGSAPPNAFPMYPSVYMPHGDPRPIMESILCQSVAPNLATSSSGPSVYPNPASDKVNFTLADEIIRDVAVYDLKGNLVLAQKASERTLNTITLEVSKLNSGTYIVEINTQEGAIYHEKFVKE